MKDAAKRVIETLGVGDFFTVIEFNSSPKSILSDVMVRATDENKASYIEEIDTLSPGGGTFFNTAFMAAYDTFDRSVLNDFTSGCHRAILFLTDGINVDDKEDLYDDIKDRQRKYFLCFFHWQ